MSQAEPDSPLVAAGAAAIALAEAWETFWAAVRALEEANRHEQ